MIELTRTLGERYHRLNDTISVCTAFSKHLNDYTDVDGVPTALEGVNTLVRSLTLVSEELGKELKARRDYFQPYATQYVKRDFAITKELDEIKRRIVTQSHAIASKRTSLLEDGVPLNAVLLAYPDYDPTADHASIAALEAEKACWQLFWKYNTPEYLPTHEILSKPY